ncbi:MAG: phosphoribosyl transferase [Candidatus Kerfeldbacteria bacterium]|nr:phosphoribosyl transferase [Candidatus Kerfeldbacteria bacterium]
MQFANREDAGRQLAEALRRFHGNETVVFALPRGGVVLGAEVARVLKAPLTLSIPRKVGHPVNPEYAVCAVTERGAPVCNEQEVASLDPAWLERAIAAERKEAARRRSTYLGTKKAVSGTGKVALIVDDGVATGLTMRAAIRDVRDRKPARLVVAIPVVPADTARLLRKEADELVVLAEPAFFRGAVGAYYDDFPQVTDDEVIALLQNRR